jgi:hypothetical protein
MSAISDAYFVLFLENLLLKSLLFHYGDFRMNHIVAARDGRSRGVRTGWTADEAIMKKGYFIKSLG